LSATRTHKIKLNLTPAQAQTFAQAAGAHRFAFNWGLAEWNRQQLADEASVRDAFFAAKSSQFPWVDDLAPSIFDAAFDELATAIRRFRQGQSAAPCFKKKRGEQMAFQVASDDFWLNNHALHIPGLGSVNMTEVLRYSGDTLAATISRDVTGNWYAAISVRLAQRPAHPSRRLVDQQPHEMLENQDHLAEAEKQLSRLERSLSRKRRGSRRWKKARLRVHRTYRRIKHIRQDRLYKLAADLATYYRLGGRDDPPDDGERHSEQSLYP
jgi:putative transposase